jgi:hypothetical protein
MAGMPMAHRRLQHVDQVLGLRRGVNYLSVVEERLGVLHSRFVSAVVHSNAEE